MLLKVKDQLELKKKLKHGYLNYLLLFLFVLLNTNGFSQNKLRIACVGNSITYGARIKGREYNSYPVQLGSMLGENYDVRNFGRSATTLLKKGDLPYWETSEYREALIFNPDIVFIKLGTNDTKPQNRIYLNSDYVKDYKDLIASFRDLPSKPTVILLVPAPVAKSDTTGITSIILKEKIIPMIRRIAWETGCEIVDLYNLMIESPEIFPDRIYPSATGVKVISHRLYEYVRMQVDSSFDFTGALPEDATPFNYYGFQGYEFTFMGKKSKVVVPKKAASGHPWIWRGCYWGHEPQVEIALLERGFHVVYSDIVDLWGNDVGMFLWSDFYQMLTNCGLSDKPVMEGMSRGGMFIYLWASKYPNRIGAIYADAPLLDFKEYFRGRNSSFPNKWKLFKESFGLKTNKEALAFRGNPIDLTDVLANAGFPMLHVVGDVDDVVPIIEHTLPFEKKIKEAGGEIQVIHKPGIGHHPHSLPNPQPIVDFILMAID